MTGAELRASILQAAVQGKLVPQDPTDEPASVLIERIREERRALVKAGKAKAPKGGESVITRCSDGTVWEQRGKGKPVEITDEVPFDIPDGWEWARIPSVTTFQEGPGVLKKDFRSSGIPLIRIAGLQTSRVTLDGCNYLDPAMVAEKWAHFALDFGDIVISTSASMDKIATVDDEAVGAIPYTGQIRFKMSDALLPEFFKAFIRSPYYASQVQSFAAGTAIKHYGPTHLQQMLIVVPPLAEQQRIVVKLDELMPLVERYDRLDRERTELNAGIEGAMRASVLQAAVQGQLTEREDGDEPASELLERIREERRALVKAGKAKAPKGGESRIWRASDGTVWEQRGKGKAIDITDEIPFDIPDGWEWSRLEEVGVWKAGSTPLKSNATYYENGSIPWLLVGDLNDGHVGQAHHFITEHAIEECPLQINPAGSVLVAMYMSIGKAGILDIEAATNQAICACQPYIASMSEWVFIYILSQRNALNEQGAGSTQKNISRAKLVEMLIPVPPLAEQQRIVAKLDEMLPKVGRLGELAS